MWKINTRELFYDLRVFLVVYRHVWKTFFCFLMKFCFSRRGKNCGSSRARALALIRYVFFTGKFIKTEISLFVGRSFLSCCEKWLKFVIWKYFCIAWDLLKNIGHCYIQKLDLNKKVRRLSDFNTNFLANAMETNFKWIFKSVNNTARCFLYRITCGRPI